MSDILAATDPRAYRYWVSEHVRFHDLDMLGHVNNVAYVVYVETGRASFLRDIGLWDIGSARQFVIVHFAMDYRHEVRMPADLRIGVRALLVGKSSIRIGVGIFDGDICAATAENVVVRWDMEQRGASALDEDDRARLLPHLASPADALSP